MIGTARARNSKALAPPLDFRIKKLKRGHCGLNIGFCPGPWRGDPMPDDAIHFSEDVFWMLEPALMRHSAYTSSHHYGVCEIAREQWLLILVDWQRIRSEFARARLSTDVPILRILPKHLRPIFHRDFRRNCRKMERLTEQLDAWIRNELQRHEGIFVAGL